MIVGEGNCEGEGEQGKERAVEGNPFITLVIR